MGNGKRLAMMCMKYLGSSTYQSSTLQETMRRIEAIGLQLIDEAQQAYMMYLSDLALPFFRTCNEIYGYHDGHEPIQKTLLRDGRTPIHFPPFSPHISRSSILARSSAAPERC